MYVVVFSFLWTGDEYFQLGVKHINTFLWLLVAICGSMLLRVKPEQIRHSLMLYIPTFLIALIIIACRIMFMPDRLMVFIFPPVLALIVLRQLFFCIREIGKATPIDSSLGWISLFIYIIAFGFAFAGYTFVALLILVWWYFQLAVLPTIVCISDLLDRYKERWLDKRVAAMRERITYVGGTDIKKVREVLTEAIQQVRTKDQYGREIVEPKYGIRVVVSDMADSSVNIAVKQYVLVPERIGYVDRSKEVIYEALNAAGITIPFPQCDVHLIKDDTEGNQKL